MAEWDWDWVGKIIVPSFTGAIGVLGTFFTLRSRERSDQAQRDQQQTNLMLTTQAQRDQAKLSYDASTSQTLTERFNALMDGYESRIADLTAELKETKERIRGIERDFKKHRSICAGCMSYQAYMKDHPDAFSDPA